MMLISLIMVISGAVSMWKYSHRIDICRLTANDIKLGNYAEGEITEYIGYTYGRKFRGINATWIETDGEYDVYTIPMSDGKYVQIRVVDSDIKRRLEKYSMGKGEGVHFLGRVRKIDNSGMKSFIDKVDGVRVEDVVQGYAIDPVDPDAKAKLFWGGLAFLVISVFLFLNSLVHFGR